MDAKMLDGKVAIISGASYGMGKTMAELFAEEPFHYSSVTNILRNVMHTRVLRSGESRSDVIPDAVFCSEQSVASDLPRWCGERVDQLDIKATFNLANNAAVFVRQGLGLALVLDKLVYTGSDSDLCCRPLEPPLETKMYIIWRKYQVFSPAAELLLHALTGVIDGEAQK